MKHFAFVLSMPNCGSWNGKWTGESNLYATVKSFPNKSEHIAKITSKKSHYYDFKDGWVASVDIKEVSSEEKKEIKKNTKGFCGYDWMVADILLYGRIRDYEEKKAARTQGEKSNV